jgi:uncharacterized damage-inducible protein DinB
VVHYGGADLARSFREVRGNTITIAEEIPEDKYAFQPAPDVRSVGRLLAHIAVAPGLQRQIHTNRIDDLKQVNFAEIVARSAAEEAKPRTKAEILALLTSEGGSLAAFLEGLSDAVLAERVKMPPGSPLASKSRLEMLMSVKEHEMHHRGQLMLTQRMLGLVPHITRRMQERMQAHAAGR